MVGRSRMASASANAGPASGRHGDSWRTGGALASPVARLVATCSVLALLERGYAIFLLNPRGSAGYGQEFARGVLGDMAGADTHDYLSGLDALADRGLVDPQRVGVTG